MGPMTPSIMGSQELADQEHLGIGVGGFMSFPYPGFHQASLQPNDFR